MPNLQFLMGLGFALGGWVVPRVVARAEWARVFAIVLDMLMPMLLFGWLCTLTSRPIFAGAITFALGAGFAYADSAKRRALCEPIVFTDVFQALDIAKHPKLALPFPHRWRVVSGALGALTIFAICFSAESGCWIWSPWPGLLFSGLTALAMWTALFPASRWNGAMLRRLQPTGDATMDAKAYGPFAMQWVHGLIARAERGARRGHSPLATARKPAIDPLTGPVILVQSESFFDARRLHSGIPKELLGRFDECCQTGLQWGRLAVPCWGANTVRTEFEALTGLTRDDTGMDWFDPYHRFADRPVASLAWHFRAQGYRTICVHPFDRTFYRRDRVMENLGFDDFLGEEAFEHAERVNGFVSDAEVARKAIAILEREGPRTFLFLITMENHGPWDAGLSSTPNLQPLLPDGDPSFNRYLEGLRNTNRMLDVLVAFLTTQAMPGMLAFYGDHLPSLRKLFQRHAMHDRSTDYFIWKPHASGGLQIDMTVDKLWSAIEQAHQTPNQL